jgi:hypothetical protein
VNPLRCAELQKLVAEVSNVPPSLLEKVHSIYSEKSN